MSNGLELKKRQVELLRVEAARAELELHIVERLEEIKRLEKNIDIQDARAAELRGIIETIQGG